jgi:hypothetical protein
MKCGVLLFLGRDLTYSSSARANADEPAGASAFSEISSNRDILETDTQELGDDFIIGDHELQGLQ